MREILQIVAHDEKVKELFVNHIELRDGLRCNRIENAEEKSNFPTGGNLRWFRAEVQGIFRGLRDLLNQSHSAALAFAGSAGAHLGIHGAHVNRDLSAAG